MNKSIIAAFALASTLLLATSCDVLNAGQSNTANTLSALNTGGGMLTNLLSNVRTFWHKPAEWQQPVPSKPK